ncbi:exodeoxyribonuclease V subunit gamma [Myxococcota bacterium]|nr:exodeoxyribonuclease V subunit gamma [Myxococcota bacterium]
MGSLTLLLGRTRWRRREALPVGVLHADAVSGVGRPAALFLTDAPLGERALEREQLEAQADRFTFEPQLKVYTALLEELATRHGGGRAILPDRSLALIAQRVVEQSPQRFPWMRQMGATPALGQALAQLHQAALESDRDPIAGAPHEDELREAMSAIDRAVERVPGHRTRARAFRELLSVVERPPAALRDWLRAQRTVVVSDLLQPTALRRNLLIALSRAWVKEGCEVIITFEIGVDLAGQAAARFFDYEDLDGEAWSLKAFAATRRLRKELFDALVGEGDARVVVAGPDGLVEVEPGVDYPGESDPDLTDLMFRDAPLQVEGDPYAFARAQLGDGRVRLARLADPDAELRFIAREVKDALLAGTRPKDCVVALADLSARADRLRAVFNDHGLPFALSSGQPLGSSPVARLVLRIARLALRDFPAEDLLDVLRSELVRPSPPLRPAQMAEWCRAAGVRGGDPATWEAPLRAWLGLRYKGDDLDAKVKNLPRSLDLLSQITGWMEPLAQPATAEEYRDRLLFVTDKLRLSQRVGACEEDPEVARANLQAWGATLRQLDGMVQDLRVVTADRWPAMELYKQLEAAIQDGAWQPSQAGATRVQVMSAAELRGLTPKRLWLGGLVRSAFPPPPGVPFLVPRKNLRDAQPVDPVAEARYLFCSLLRNTLRGPEPDRLTLSWAAAEDGKTLAPSPIVEELLSVPLNLPAEAEARSFGRYAVDDIDLDGVPPRSRSDALRAAADEPAWRALLPAADLTLADLHDEVVADRAAEAPFGARDGLLSTAPAPPEEIAVTALESYLRCPARYWFSAVLHLGPPEEWNAEVAATRRGTALHEVLESFFKRRGLAPVRPGEPEERVAKELYDAATEVFDRVEAEGNFDRELFRWQRARWVAGLIDDEPKGVLACWLAREQENGLDAEPMAVEHEFRGLQVGPLSVRGKIDRVDRVPGGLLLTDYKTGKVQNAKRLERGLLIQPVLYAEALTQANPGQPVAACYYEMKAPKEMGRVGWSGDGELVKKLAGPRVQPAIFDHTRGRAYLDHAARAAERLSRGRFHPTLAGDRDADCEHCDFSRVCRVSHERSERLRPHAEGLDLQAPLRDDGP